MCILMSIEPQMISTEKVNVIIDIDIHGAITVVIVLERDSVSTNPCLIMYS